MGYIYILEKNETRLTCKDKRGQFSTSEMWPTGSESKQVLFLSEKLPTQTQTLASIEAGYLREGERKNSHPQNTFSEEL